MARAHRRGAYVVSDACADPWRAEDRSDSASGVRSRGALGVARTAEFFPGGCAAWQDPLRAPPTARGIRRRRRKEEEKKGAEEEDASEERNASSRGPDRETVALAFPGPVRPGERVEVALRVGSVGSVDGGASAVAFAFDDLDPESTSRGFSIEPVSGTAEPGASVIARLAFAPPAETRPEQLAYHGLSEWVECRATLRLTGGAPRARVGVGEGDSGGGVEEDSGAEVAVSARCELLPPKTPAELAEEARAVAEAREAERQRRIEAGLPPLEEEERGEEGEADAEEAE